MRFTISAPIETIKPYEAGKPLKELEREFKITHAVKLASNENPFGFSPKVKDVIIENINKMNRYPEPIAHDLSRLLAQRFQVGFHNIVLGNGSDDIIALLAHGFLNPGDEALMPHPAFSMYEISVKTAKGVPVQVPLVDHAMDLEGMVKRVGPRTKLIFITNPFNPTGAAITREQFLAFSQKIPQDVILVVDEAYIEFVRDKAVFNSLDRPLADSRVVTLRTFSKAYGLAGFRIGYGVMDREIAEILNRIRQPFNVNTLASEAALAALQDQAFVDQTIESIHKGIDDLASALTQMGFEPLPTQSNFLMVNIRTDATKVFNDLLRHGVIVRSLKSYGFDTCLRINSGTPEENQIFITALKAVLGKNH